MVNSISRWFIRFSPSLLLFVVTALISLLPTVSLGSIYIGGGPFRQWLLNTFFFPLLSDAAGHQVVAHFDQASLTGEMILVLPVLLLLSFALLPIMFYVTNKRRLS